MPVSEVKTRDCVNLYVPWKHLPTHKVFNSSLFSAWSVPPPLCCTQFNSSMKRKFENSDSDDGDSDAPEEVGRQYGSSWQRQRQQPSSSQEHGELDAEASGSAEEDGEESSEELEQQEQAIEQQLADIPFEVLEKLSRDGKGPTPAAARAAALEAKHKVFHRETKNRPQEVSSKKPVSRFREIIQVPKQ